MDIYDKYKNSDIIKKFNDNFDVSLNGYKVYNQEESLTCWIYAGFNTIKNELAIALNTSIDKIDLSVNYISFYDRIEKFNRIYDEIINNEYKVSDIKYLLFNYINTCGNFKSFKYLVKKYGIVFENQMPMNDNCYIPNRIDDLLKQKVIVDIEELLNRKKNKEDLKQLKEKYMEENHKILEKIYGTPPKETIIGSISKTIEHFKKEYIDSIIDNYISICSLESLEYNTKYDVNFLDMKIDDEEYLNLDLEVIKKAIIKSLNDNTPVWFGCSFNYMSGSYKNKEGILDDNLYDFNQIGIKKTKKSVLEKYNMLSYSHAMVFTGYENKNNIIKWKVLNTFGEDNNRKGYYIMNENFFKSNVFMFAISKKYLQI